MAIKIIILLLLVSALVNIFLEPITDILFGKKKSDWYTNKLPEKAKKIYFEYDKKTGNISTYYTVGKIIKRKRYINLIEQNIHISKYNMQNLTAKSPPVLFNELKDLFVLIKSMDEDKEIGEMDHKIFPTYAQAMGMIQKQPTAMTSDYEQIMKGNLK